MYNTILLPLALDQGHGSRSMEIARRLRAEGGKIVAVHVLDKIPGFASYYMSPDNEKMPVDIEKEIHESAKKAIAERIGAEKDVEAVVLTGHPGRTITDYAEKIGADCIIGWISQAGNEGLFPWLDCRSRHALRTLLGACITLTPL